MNEETPQWERITTFYETKLKQIKAVNSPLFHVHVNAMMTASLSVILSKCKNEEELIYVLDSLKKAQLLRHRHSQKLEKKK